MGHCQCLQTSPKRTRYATVSCRRRRRPVASAQTRVPFLAIPPPRPLFTRYIRLYLLTNVYIYIYYCVHIIYILYSSSFFSSSSSISIHMYVCVHDIRFTFSKLGLTITYVRTYVGRLSTTTCQRSRARFFYFFLLPLLLVFFFFFVRKPVSQSNTRRHTHTHALK